MSDSEAQDSLECTLCTKVIQALRMALNHLQTRSQKVMTQHHHPLRYLKWYLKSKTTVRYHNGKRGDNGVRKNYTAKYSWLAPDIDGEGAFCKFCKKHCSGSCGLPKGSDGTFITKPFTKWSKATGSTVKNNKLLKHQQSNSHRQTVEEA